MSTARRLPMVALAVSAAVAAVVVVGMAPSTAPSSHDPLMPSGDGPSEGRPARAPVQLSPDGAPLRQEPGEGPVGRGTSPAAAPAGAPRPGAPSPTTEVGGGSTALPTATPGGRSTPSPSGRPAGGAGGTSPGAAGGGPAGSSGSDEGPPDGFRDDASAERADWLEDRMTAFVDTIIPEARGTELSRSCSSNGRTCTFEGPATDDFATRWVQALSYGDMDDSTLQGTTLKDLSFYETDDGLRFSITARHPKEP